MSSDIDESFHECIPDDAQYSGFQQKLQVQRRRYIRNKLLHDMLLEMIREGFLNSNLSQKVKDILIHQDALESISLNESDMLSLLGLKREHLTPVGLTFEEQCKLKSAFERYLSQYYHTFQNSHADLLRANLCTNMNDMLIKDLKERLSLKQQEDVENLTQTSLNLDQIIKLRTEELSKIVARKLEEYELKMKIMNAKYKMLYYRLKLSVFTESDKCFEAYQELIRDVRAQQEACQKNIEALALQKEKYTVVQSKEFDSILQAYLQYKTLIHEKKALLEKLQK